MGVDAARVAAEAAGPEELAVRGRGEAAAEHRRERLALLLVDQTPQRQGIGLVADMPVRRPGELAEAGDAARLGHARQAEIEPVGEEARHQDLRVGGGLAGSQMGEAVGEQRPSRHLRQEIGDADARQHGVEARGEGLGFRRRRFLDRRDLQHALVERDIRQQAALRLGVDRRQPLVEQRSASGDEALEVGVDRDRQGAALFQLLQGLAGDQALLEGAISPAAHHPDIAGAQPVAQFRQHAELVVAPIDVPAAQHMARPALPDEAGRRGFRQAGRGRAVHLAQHVDGAHERRRGRHALEDEGIKESRSPAADAGIVLAEHLVGVELFRPRQRLGFRDGRAEAVPRDHRGDRVKGVLLVVARGDQSGADAGVEADLLVDGAAIGLEGAGMPPLGLAEHRPDQPVEQIDGLVRQAGGEIEGDGDQGGMPALALVAGDMLHRGAAGLAGELSKAGLMHAMPARRIEADRADMLQTLDQAEHRSGLCRFRHLAQPGEPALAGFRPALRQRIQPTPLLGGQPIGQPALDLAARLIAQLDAEPLECAGRRDDDPALPAFLHHQPGQMSEPVVLDRMRQQPAGQTRRPDACRRDETRDGPAIRPHGAVGSAPQRDNRRWPPEERRSARRRTRESGRGGRSPRVSGRPGIAQVAKHQRVTETIMIATAAPDRGEVRGGQCVVAHQLTLIRRRIEQRGDLGFGQLLSSHHSCLPDP